MFRHLKVSFGQDQRQLSPQFRKEHGFGMASRCGQCSRKISLVESTIRLYLALRASCSVCRCRCGLAFCERHRAAESHAQLEFKAFWASRAPEVHLRLAPVAAGEADEGESQGKRGLSGA